MKNLCKISMKRLDKRWMVWLSTIRFCYIWMIRLTKNIRLAYNWNIQPFRFYSSTTFHIPDVRVVAWYYKFDEWNEYVFLWFILVCAISSLKFHTKVRWYTLALFRIQGWYCYNSQSYMLSYSFYPLISSQKKIYR